MSYLTSLFLNIEKRKKKKRKKREKIRKMCKSRTNTSDIVKFPVSLHMEQLENCIETNLNDIDLVGKIKAERNLLITLYAST